jgi:hypothetical protein
VRERTVNPDFWTIGINGLQSQAEPLAVIRPLVLTVMSITGGSDDGSGNDSESSSGTLKSFEEHYADEELSIILFIIGAILFFTVPIFGQVVGIISIIIGILVWFSDWLWG